MMPPFDSLDERWCGYEDEDGFTVEVCTLTRAEHDGMDHEFGQRDEDEVSRNEDNDGEG